MAYFYILWCCFVILDVWQPLVTIDFQKRSVNILPNISFWLTHNKENHMVLEQCEGDRTFIMDELSL